jgi:hypothetical protein
MEDRLKFTDRVEDIPKIPRKLKRKLFGKNGRDPLTFPLPKREDEERWNDQNYNRRRR